MNYETVPYNETPEEEMPEKAEGEIEDARPSIFSPEGILILFVALFFDLLGVITLILTFAFGMGVVASWIVDITALIVIGLWALWRFKKVPLKKRIARRIGLRIGIASLVEVIPLVGDIAPSWTILVWSLLKK